MDIMYTVLPDGITGQYLWIEFEVFVVLVVEEADFRFVFYENVEEGDGMKKRRRTESYFCEGFVIIVEDPIIVIQIDDKVRCLKLVRKQVPGQGRRLTLAPCAFV